MIGHRMNSTAEIENLLKQVGEIPNTLQRVSNAQAANSFAGRDAQGRGGEMISHRMNSTAEIENLLKQVGEIPNTLQRVSSARLRIHSQQRCARQES